VLLLVRDKDNGENHLDLSMTQMKKKTITTRGTVNQGQLSNKFEVSLLQHEFIF